MQIMNQITQILWNLFHTPALPATAGPLWAVRAEESVACDSFFGHFSAFHKSNPLKLWCCLEVWTEKTLRPGHLRLRLFYRQAWALYTGIYYRLNWSGQGFAQRSMLALWEDQRPPAELGEWGWVLNQMQIIQWGRKYFVIFKSCIFTLDHLSILI